MVVADEEYAEYFGANHPRSRRGEFGSRPLLPVSSWTRIDQLACSPLGDQLINDRVDEAAHISKLRPIPSTLGTFGRRYQCKDNIL
jgi:hypothetical protein